jgi:hypothetical protein
MKTFQKDMAQLGGMIENFYGGANNNEMKNNNNKNNNNKNNNNKNMNMKNNNKNMNMKNNNKNMNMKNNNKNMNMKNNNNKTNNKMKNMDKDGKAKKRSFKVISVDGKKRDMDGSYKGAEPKVAARKAFLKICKKMNINKASCKLIFTLQETTRGSDKRIYGPYEGQREKLAKTRVKTFKDKETGEVRKIVQTHASVVRKLKK